MTRHRFQGLLPPKILIYEPYNTPFSKNNIFSTPYKKTFEYVPKASEEERGEL